MGVLTSGAIVNALVAKPGAWSLEEASTNATISHSQRSVDIYEGNERFRVNNVVMWFSFKINTRWRIYRQSLLLMAT
jgi:hypothetical protein